MFRLVRPGSHNVSCGTPEAFGLVSHLGKEFRPVGISTRCLYLSPFTESAPIDWSNSDARENVGA